MLKLIQDSGADFICL
jgi:endonuclease/exonuclease/phosphatase family metal-dependent hydrolase